MKWESPGQLVIWPADPTGSTSVPVGGVSHSPVALSTGRDESSLPKMPTTERGSMVMKCQSPAEWLAKRTRAVREQWRSGAMIIEGFYLVIRDLNTIREISFHPAKTCLS